jgi:hypothetical protein
MLDVGCSQHKSTWFFPASACPVPGKCAQILWLKTAARGKQLTSLDHAIREGNSVISHPAVHPKAFDWQAAFPEVFAQGGFAVVVGNPPYIRQELLSPFKPWLPTLPGRNGRMRIPTTVNGLGQDPTAPARGQSPPGLRTPPA